MKTFLLATSNPGKTKLYRQMLPAEDFTILSLCDLRETYASPIEDGLTVRDNARIKAQFFAGLTGLPTLGDDSGLIIPSLGGEP